MSPKVVLEITPDRLEAYLEARERKRRASAQKMSLYYNDPVAFVHDCISFPEGQGLTAYQEEVMSELPIQKRVAQRGPHGLGKTGTAAWLILWFSLTRDAAGVDWKCPITAGAWRQLEQYLMPEVHKWAKCLRWDRIGRDPFRRGELLTLNLNLNFGSAFAVASNVPAYIEGAHADSILYIYDESKSIIDATFDAAEGAFSGAGTDGREAFALASSTPGEPIGRFYDISMSKKGFQDWWPRHVTLDEAVAAGRINPDWVTQRGEQWGEDSQLFANRVLGEFHASDEDTIIPLSWIEQANERWYEHAKEVVGEVDRIGVDVARSGKDKTVVATVRGFRVEELHYAFHQDTVKTEKKVIQVMELHNQAIATIDADGLGAGVYDHVMTDIGKERVRPFHASAATDWLDISGELSFLNTRAAAWWKLREMLDPGKGSTLELPPDDQLLADLTAPKRKESARGKIQVESKDDVKKRLGGRSTDAADAVIMSLWQNRKRRRRRMGDMGWGQSSAGEDALVS
jgi:hypothetical protein